MLLISIYAYEAFGVLSFFSFNKSRISRNKSVSSGVGGGGGGVAGFLFCRHIKSLIIINTENAIQIKSIVTCIKLP